MLQYDRKLSNKMKTALIPKLITDFSGRSPDNYRL